MTSHWHNTWKLRDQPLVDLNNLVQQAINLDHFTPKPSLGYNPTLLVQQEENDNPKIVRSAPGTLLVIS